MGPGEINRMAPSSCPGMDVGVWVGKGVDVCEGSGVIVGTNVLVGVLTCVDAMAVSVPATFAASAVSTITVGRYSGG